VDALVESQCSAECTASVAPDPSAQLGVWCEVLGPVHTTGVDVQLNGDLRSHQPPRVVHHLVSEQIEVADVQVRRREAGQRLSASVLSLLDDRFAAAWESWGDFNARSRRRRKGMATYRLVRYAGDFVVLAAGTRRMSPWPDRGRSAHPVTRRVDSRVIRVQSGLYGWSGVSSRARRAQWAPWSRSDWAMVVRPAGAA
jgi:hypothetical protein